MNLAGNVLTAKEIYESLQEGRTDLYEKRFSFGREQDFNEFTISLEDRGMLPIIPYKLGLEDLYKLSKDNEDVIQNIKNSRAQDKES